MNTTKPLLGLTAEDLMNRNGVTIPQQMPMRDADQLLRRAKSESAPVVDERGRCVGVLTASDLLRWAQEGGTGAEEGRTPSCYTERPRVGLGSPGENEGRMAGRSCAEQGSDNRCRATTRQRDPIRNVNGIQECGCPTTRVGISGTRWNRSVMSVCNFAS